MRALCSLALVLPLLSLGCRNAPVEALRTKDPEVVERRLQTRLDELVDGFAHGLDAVLSQVETTAPDRPQRRKALAWKALLTNHARGLLLEPDARKTLVDLWVLMIQLDEYARGVHVDPVLRAHLDTLLKLLGRMRKEARRIARTALPPDRFEEVRTALVKFAREHPMRDQSGPRGVGLTVERPGGALSWVSGLSDIPSVFLDDTAQAISDASDTVHRLTLVAQHLPQRINWQAQLLAYDLEDRAATQRLLESVETASVGIAQIGSAAKALPASVRKTLSESTETLTPTLRTIRDTVGDLRATVATITTVVHDARSTSGRLTLAGEAWGNAVKEVRGLVADATADDPNEPKPTEPEPPSRPFDIREYTATAASITSAAHSLRGAIVEARGLVTSTGEVKTVADHAADRAGSLIGKAAWSLALLVLLTFGVAFAYRWACLRYLPTPEAPGDTAA